MFRLPSITSLVWNTYRQCRWEIYKRAHYQVRMWLEDRTQWPLSLLEDQIVRDLIEKGYAVSTLEDLPLAYTKDLRIAMENTVEALQCSQKITQGKPFAMSLSKDQVMNLGLLLWGLDEGLLRMGSSYLGRPLTYRGVLARRDDPTGQETESRFWHRDPEDWKALKVIVYLKDVEDQDGPFECIPRKYTTRLNWYAKDRKGRMHHNDFLEETKVSFTGKAGTVILADTCRVYHRGKTGTANPRFALFYCYTAQKPSLRRYCHPLFDRNTFLFHYGDGLSSLQRACLGRSA